jgi:SAM-dependent methyltransferase
MKLTYKDFEDAFGESLNTFVKEKIQLLDFSYNEVSNNEEKEILLTIIKTLFNVNVKKAGEHRLQDWVRGWEENYNEFVKNNKRTDLIPKYFGKLPYIRWKQKFIKPINREFEYNTVKILQYWLFNKYFSNVDNVYEYGCGTGHNLFRANDANPETKIYGLDWTTTSQKIIKQINKIFALDFKSHQFDYFNIDKDYKIEENSAVFTFASLEQVGEKGKDFIQYLIKQQPKICVHIEPMGEYLDPNNLNDYLSLKYFEKRCYVRDLRNYLVELQDKNIIEIIQDQRSNIGSMYVDGYSILVWKVKK